jgi:hypothetical protein
MVSMVMKSRLIGEMNEAELQYISSQAGAWEGGMEG